MFDNASFTQSLIAEARSCTVLDHVAVITKQWSIIECKKSINFVSDVYL